MHWLSEFRFRFNHIKNGACVNRGFAGKFKPKIEEKVNLGKKKTEDEPSVHQVD
jgi:hypothetical protein